MTPQPPRFTLFPYTTLFRSLHRPRQSDKCDPENSESDELPEVAGYPELVSSILGECHSRVVGVRIHGMEQGRDEQRKGTADSRHGTDPCEMLVHRHNWSFAVGSSVQSNGSRLS